jgi:DnaJ-class molecular chaperone
MSSQRQDSLSDQMREVVRLATEAGCYDAADWIRKHWSDPCPECSGRGFHARSESGGDSEHGMGWANSWSEMCTACGGTGKRRRAAA